tara:strand:+ start:186 stop:701 length:516 start_codon:yes stop_codon:yes gene_type:complete
MNVRENHDIIIAHHPHYKSLNKKLVEDSLKIEFKEGSILEYEKISAKMTGMSISSSSISLVKEWLKQLILTEWNYDTRAYGVEIPDAWFVRYSKGDQSFPHDHLMSLLSFVYFISCPKGSAPLVFTTSGKKIKAEEGKVVLFPATVLHHVPKNKCEDRLVLAGNLFFTLKY